VTDYIESKFREELLFFTMNHPTNSMLAFIAQQITKIMDVPGRVDQLQILDEILGWTFYPLHPNHVRALGLTFGTELIVGRAQFRIRGKFYEFGDAVRVFFDYYAAHEELVALNVIRYEHDSAF
jgi:hypothetical protein